MHSYRSSLRLAGAARLRAQPCAQPCDQVLWAGLGPASLQLTSIRGIKLFEVRDLSSSGWWTSTAALISYRDCPMHMQIFSKEARAERRRKLKVL